MAFHSAKIVEKHTFLELQHEDVSKSGLRMRTQSDSFIELPCIEADQKESFEVGSSDSTCDSFDAQSISSDDMFDAYSWNSISSPTLPSPRTTDSGCECCEIPKTPHWTDDDGFYSFEITGMTPTSSPRLEYSHSDQCSMHSELISESNLQSLYPATSTSPMQTIVTGSAAVAQSNVMWMTPIMLPCSVPQVCPEMHLLEDVSYMEQACSHKSEAIKKVSKGCKASKKQPSQESPLVSTGGTTVIVRNLPDDCTLQQLLNTLDREGFSGAYDFVHLPVDFASKTPLRYALINLVDSSKAKLFVKYFTNFKEGPACIFSAEDCSVSFSTSLQGLAAHIERYRNSSVMHASVPDEYKPALFSNGQRKVFPRPTERIKAPRIRGQKVNKA